MYVCMYVCLCVVISTVHRSNEIFKVSIELTKVEALLLLHLGSAVALGVLLVHCVSFE